MNSRWALISNGGPWRILNNDGTERPYRWYHKVYDKIFNWWWFRNWRKLQSAVGEDKRFYGDGGTIHHSNHVDVETDAGGAVVAVWFRCQPIPFRQTKSDQQRCKEMVGMYEANPAPDLCGVVVRDKKSKE